VAPLVVFGVPLLVLMRPERIDEFCDQYVEAPHLGFGGGESFNECD
jgi:hypothetical protein